MNYTRRDQGYALGDVFLFFTVIYLNRVLGRIAGFCVFSGYDPNRDSGNNLFLSIFVVVGA